MISLIKHTLLCFVLVLSVQSVAGELVTGKVVGRHIFGLASDVNGDPLMIEERPLIFDDVVFEKKISTIGEKSFYISGFGDQIGGLYLSLFDDDRKRFIDTYTFDLSTVSGLVRPRGAQVTNWGSMLFSETLSIDGDNPKSFVDVFKSYFKGKAELVKPYNYGWVSEAILLNQKGSAKIIKNYSIGRLFASQLHMMPDGKSLYLLDAENSGQLYLYLAKETGSLTEGKLYGVSINDDKTEYDLLGNASALKMKFKLKRISFSKLFKKVPLKEGRCSSGYEQIVTIYGEECLKIKKRNRKYVGLFEPIRTLAIKRSKNQLNRFKKIKFNKEKNQAELTRQGGEVLKLSLGQTSGLDSSYAIKEVQR